MHERDPGSQSRQRPIPRSCPRHHYVNPILDLRSGERDPSVNSKVWTGLDISSEPGLEEVSSLIAMIRIRHDIKDEDDLQVRYWSRRLCP